MLSFSAPRGPWLVKLHAFRRAVQERVWYFENAERICPVARALWDSELSARPASNNLG